MMSEKRFYLGNNDTIICDRSQGGSDGFNMLRKFEVVDLLNEQQATIKELEEEIRLLKPTNIEQYEQIGRLQRENGEQQATINDLERKLRILTAHLLSDECCLTENQIGNIIKEIRNVKELEE